MTNEAFLRMMAHRLSQELNCREDLISFGLLYSKLSKFLVLAVSTTGKDGRYIPIKYRKHGKFGLFVVDGPDLWDEIKMIADAMCEEKKFTFPISCEKNSMTVGDSLTVSANFAHAIFGNVIKALHDTDMAICFLNCTIFKENDNYESVSIENDMEMLDMPSLW